ncbi:hypothetical protein Trco_006585 [Trichoderma cornu-damae]|uniref:Uncharacterized protein n=1 Tax=Trichoderma cornu-damae TaxID=654480 RepID=A0A9P8QKU8_9HYPO|nr:hypothetical protein Trco_006585 [Trichoderma cornu-damae]
MRLWGFWGCGQEWGGEGERVNGKSRRSAEVRAMAWPIGGSITPARRDLIAESRPLGFAARDQGSGSWLGIRDPNLISSSFLDAGLMILASVSGPRARRDESQKRTC